ncbi:unnamed protein product [Peronospora farinosa]|uniref:Nucleotide-diphospho-sugar transferase domain-containing protein n=1 Tax=Peronospora farinosa TaxID=134698 RepID=A0AAV0USU3_9STRA|nr:unnamed protein product [Peronospora farinosa]
MTCLSSFMRRRWIVLAFAAIVIFVLIDFFFTWERLTLTAWSSSTSHFFSIRGNSTIIQTKSDSLAQPNDFADATIPKTTVPKVIPMKVEHNASRTASEREQIQVDDRATSRLELLESEQTDQLELDKQLVYTLSQIIQRTTTKRGIVMPLFEKLTGLGLSLILELRAMGVSLPIEVPHCTELNPKTLELLQTKKELGKIRAYDICDLAANAKSATNTSRPVFCDNIDACHTKFRSFMIKPLSIVYSQFDQILMLDADTSFFLNPTVLFDSEKFKTTGILLMHDRIGGAGHLARKAPRQPNLSVEQEYFSTFNVTPFRPVPTLQRPKATVPNKTPVKLNFEPSDFLLSSHSFNRRASHQADSSQMFWNKKLQPRATVILASFLAQSDIAPPPSHGDKELFFFASELAETQYSFSDYSAGSIGSEFEDGGPKKSTLCGILAHVFPIRQEGVPDDDVPLFSLNNKRVLIFRPDLEPFYYMKARPWELFPGFIGSRHLHCPFNITVGRLNESHIKHFTERRKFLEQGIHEVLGLEISLNGYYGSQLCPYSRRGHIGEMEN